MLIQVSIVDIFQAEFPDEVLAQYGLERIEYFIWNNTCSHIFFQCAIGQTFMLKVSLILHNPYFLLLLNFQ